NACDELHVPELGRRIAVSIVDAGKATCFFHAREVGLLGTEPPAAFTEEILQRFWAIRKAAAIACGLGPDSRQPAPVAVAEPADYQDFVSGRTVRSGEVSFVARRVIGPPPRLHKAFASTGAVCTATAARIAGTIVHGVCSSIDGDVVRIGHPSGVFPVRVRLGAQGELVEASYSRTARRLLDGVAYVRASCLLD
ncbi:MAG: mii, partial [Rhizobacter sp.]|nr:mii [Rhizobacter sp.]